MTRAYNTATTQQNSGGAVAGFVAGKNKIINGDFYVNQRNFTTATTDGAFTFDRWKTGVGSSGGTCTFTPQTFTPGTAPVSGYEGRNFLQLLSASQSGASDWAAIYQNIEDIRTLAGQTITISFWAKAASGTPNIGVTVTQNFGTGGSTSINYSPSVQTVTTSWARYSFTIALSSLSGKTIGTGSQVQMFIFTSTGSTLTPLGFVNVGLQNNTFGIWGVQVETGPVATPFQTATGTIQGELAACQRYYWRTTTTSTGLIFATGISEDATRNWTPVYNPVEMRIPPTSVDFSALNVSDAVSFTNAVSGVNISVAGTNINRCSFVTTGQTAKQSVHILSQSGGGYLGFSAEL
jgi:hypothetical protein